MIPFIPFWLLLLVLLVVICGPFRRCRPGRVILLIALICIGIHFVRGQIRQSSPQAVYVPSAEIAPPTPTPGIVISNAAMRPFPASTTQPHLMWIDDWDQYVATTQFKGFRVSSSDTAPSQADALNESINAAAGQLMAVMMNQPAIQTRSQTPGFSSLLHQQALASIVSREVVAGQSTWSIDKSYGTLWKSWMLIDTSPARIATLNQNVLRVAGSVRTQRLAGFVTTAALLAVIVLLYGFLNVVTKGYFIWRLRAVAILVLIAGLLAVCAWV